MSRRVSSFAVADAFLNFPILVRSTFWLMQERITLLPDQEINIDLPMSGHRLIPGYSGQIGLPLEIYLRLYAVKDEEKTLIAAPGDLSRFVKRIDGEEAALRFLRLFTAPDTHYHFQRGNYTIDLDVGVPGSLHTAGTISPELAKRIDYQSPEIQLEKNEYLAERDLMRADSANRSEPVEVFRRREALSREGDYRFIEDKVKGEIRRQDVPFPSYE